MPASTNCFQMSEILFFKKEKFWFNNVTLAKKICK